MEKSYVSLETRDSKTGKTTKRTTENTELKITRNETIQKSFATSTMTTESCKKSKTTLSQINVSGYT